MKHNLNLVKCNHVLTVFSLSKVRVKKQLEDHAAAGVNLYASDKLITPVCRTEE